jgi:hypothetical protein
MSEMMRTAVRHWCVTVFELFESLSTVAHGWKKHLNSQWLLQSLGPSSLGDEVILPQMMQKRGSRR